MLKSIRTRLTLAFMALAIGPILVVGLVLSLKSFNALRDEAILHQKTEAQRIAVSVEDYIRELEHELMLTTQAHKFINLDLSEQQNILEELLAYENRFEELSLLNNTGKELIRCNRIRVVHEESLGAHGNDPLFQQTMTSGTNNFGPVYFTPRSPER